ncbi:MAG TPA: ABC transporter ATP-binding protein [Granulicella sp.]
MATSLLEITGLSVAFGERTVVHPLTFSLDAGQTLGLVGESGSGKSATSLALLRLLPPTASVAGSIRLDGEELLTLPESQMRGHRGRTLSMIFQEPMTALNPVMRVGSQIAEALEVHQPTLTGRELRSRVVEALHEVALPNPEERLNDYPHQFSGGQRQRLLIAMALIHRPRLLIADEPTTALDVTVQEQILDLLARLRATHRLAMIFISHDLAVVARACNQPGDTVAVLQHGNLVEHASALQIFHAPQHPYTRRLLASVPTMRTDRSQPLSALHESTGQTLS